MQIESIAVYALPDKAEAQQPSVDDSASNRPNVSFILSEDQGAHLSLLGTPSLQTPHIDAIAKSGVYFDNAFVAYPVCSASKASIYTGLHNHTNGILNNTYNFHKPASQVTQQERAQPLSKINFIRDPFLTLTEILHHNGYYQGVTHKLHVLPNEKFPYNEFMHGGRGEVEQFLKHAKKKKQPWFLMVNIPYSHRPYPNSDKQPIRPQPSEVSLPAYLPDTPLIRQDWAEYLAGIEKVDAVVGETMDVLKASGELDDTLVVYMSDHGPTFQHGKMTLYDLGLRVPLIFSGPGVTKNSRTKALASGVDLLPTLTSWIESQSDQPLKIPNANNSDNKLPYGIHGVSLANVLADGSQTSDREHVFAEISNRGPLPNDGIQERSVFDGRWKLILRENVDRGWRQVNADTRDFRPWGNRTYDETIRVKEQFPIQYRILAEMDPQRLGGHVPEIELYDLQNDPDEMNNLVASPQVTQQFDRLSSTLRQWAADTNDSSVSLHSLEGLSL